MPKIKKRTAVGQRRKYARFPRPGSTTPPSSASDSQDSQVCFTLFPLVFFTFFLALVAVVTLPSGFEPEYLCMYECL